MVFENVVVAYDGSDQALAAVKKAAEIVGGEEAARPPASFGMKREAFHGLSSHSFGSTHRRTGHRSVCRKRQTKTVTSKNSPLTPEARC